MKSTDSGRTVYGGAGIAPDEKFDRAKLDPFQVLLRQSDSTGRFTAWYFGSKNPTLTRDWKPSEEFLTEFHDWLLKNNVQFSEADFTA